MKDKYIDLINQTFDFPQEEFDVDNEELIWNNIPLMDLIKQYGTPLRLNYLPKVSNNIKRARRFFQVASAKCDYRGEYHYCYCTKSSHFSFVVEEAVKEGAHIETSSSFDIDIVYKLFKSDLIKKDGYIICNGHKTNDYIRNIAKLINDGFSNVYVILDNKKELSILLGLTSKRVKVGIRIASEEDPKFAFYTSRLGIGYKDIVPFYEEEIANNKQVELKMLHFFVNVGISDDTYYWNELRKSTNIYVELKKICKELDSLDVGGGFPIKRSLNFEYDYEYIAEEILYQVKTMCNDGGVEEPHIFTEFGSFTVGESGAMIYKVLDQKIQNDREKWNMIDSSFMTTLPDSWAINQRFVMLPLNKWNSKYERVFLGGLTCDSLDYYNSEQHSNAIYLPCHEQEDPLIIGFFNTGAYQETIGGYGGIQHCLIPQPKHVLIDLDEEGNYKTKLFSKEQGPKSMLKILGY